MKRCSVKPYDGGEGYIFASYCHKDRGLVFPVIESLSKAGYRVWFDEGIEPGAEWPEVIARHLNACAVCVAFISVNSVHSHNCRREINFALLKGKPFLSVFLEEVQLSLGMEMQLSSMQSVLRFTYAQRDDFLSAVRDAPVLAPCLGAPRPDTVVSDDFAYGDDGGALFASDNGRSFSDKWFEQERGDSGGDEPRPAERPGFVLMSTMRGEDCPMDQYRMYTIGRENCDFTISGNRRISRRHASLILRDDACFIRDHSSKNHTFLNGAKIPPDVDIEVREFDEIAFADAVYVLGRLRAGNPDALAPAEKPAEAKEDACVYLLRKYTGESIDVIKSPFRLGKKQAACDYVIQDNASVSRHHADLLLKDGRCYIVDRSSTNKTFLNSEEIAPNTQTPLRDGDEIMLGSERFVVRMK